LLTLAAWLTLALAAGACCPPPREVERLVVVPPPPLPPGRPPRARVLDLQAREVAWVDSGDVVTLPARDLEDLLGLLAGERAWGDAVEGLRR